VRRAALEQQLEFVGLVVMQNKTKPQSRPTVHVLSQSRVRSVMVTGAQPLSFGKTRLSLLAEIRCFAAAAC
jgi:magnesium-transporting ATPase (P-type)